MAGMDLLTTLGHQYHVAHQLVRPGRDPQS